MIGILPAGGTASRLHGLPKFLLPIGDTYLLDFHLRAHKAAGAWSTVVCASRGTAPFLAPYVQPGMQLLERETRTVAEAVLLARSRENALFTMPDTFWDDDTLLPRLAATVDDGAAISVGLWYMQPEQRGQLGQCWVSGDGITDLVDKDPACRYPWAWGALAWSPSFWQFIHVDDMHLGLALKRAIAAGAPVHPVFADGEYFDCGTWAGYARLVHHLTEDLVYA